MVRNNRQAISTWKLDYNQPTNSNCTINSGIRISFYGAYNLMFLLMMVKKFNFTFCIWFYLININKYIY